MGSIRVGVRYMSRPLRRAAEVLYAALQVTPGAVAQIDAETMRVLRRLEFVAGENLAQCLVIKDNYLYVGLGTSPGKVVKVNLKTWTEEDVETFAGGENDVRALVIYGDYLYAGLATSPGSIARVDLATFTQDATLPFAGGENSIQAMVEKDGKIYAGLYTVAGKVVKVDIATFAEEDVETFAAGENNVYSLEIEGGFLYCGLDVSPGKVVKVNLTTFNKDSTLTLAAAEEYVEGLASDGTYLYAGCATDSGLIVRITLATFTKDTTLDVLTRYVSYIDCLTILGKFLYAGTNAYGYPGLIFKVSLTNFTVVDLLQLKGETSGGDLGLTGDWGFAALDQYPGGSARFNLTTFTEAGRVAFDYQEDECTALDAGSGYAYGCTWTYPVKVKQIDATTNTVVATLTLSAGNNTAAVALIHDGKLYIGLSLPALGPSRIVKVDLATFTEEATLVLLADEVSVFGLCADDTYLYASTFNGRVIRISLATFTRVDRYVSVYNLGDCDVLDNYIYVGRSTGQGRVLKIDKTTMTLDTDLNLGAGFSNVTGARATGGFVYVTTANSPGRVVKLNPGPPFGINSWINLGAGEDVPYQLRVSGGKLYTVCYTFPAIVARIDIATFAEDASLTLEAADDNCWALSSLG